MNLVDRFIHVLNYRLVPPLCVRCNTACEAPLDYCHTCVLELPAKPRVLNTAFGEVHAAWDYHSPLDECIHGFKFHQQLHMGRILAQLALPSVAHSFPQALIPVPLHKARLRERGFNQAQELARYWAHGRGVPLLSNALIRQRATKVQSSLKAAERLPNVDGAFRAVGKIPRHVALVDDVYTTGATCAAAAKALGLQGAERVDVWCLARVV